MGQNFSLALPAPDSGSTVPPLAGTGDSKQLAKMFSSSFTEQLDQKAPRGKAS